MDFKIEDKVTFTVDGLKLFKIRYPTRMSSWRINTVATIKDRWKSSAGIIWWALYSGDGQIWAETEFIRSAKGQMPLPFNFKSRG